MYRPDSGRVLGGVAAGLAEQTGAAVGLVRLGFLLTALLGGFGIVLYAAAWVLLPTEGEDDTTAERWLRNLTTPGKRLGAFLIGAAALIVLAGAHHATLVAALTLLAAAALLSNSSNSNEPSPSTGPAGDETE